MSTPDLMAGAQDVYGRSGIGTRVGFGSSPALVVVDFQRGFTDPASPVGGDVSEAVLATARLLAAARAAELPIAYTAVGFDPGLRDGATWLRKMPGLGGVVEGSPWCEIERAGLPAAQRARMAQAGLLGLLRNAADPVPHRCACGHPDRDWMCDQRLRARDDRRLRLLGISHDRAPGVRGRSRLGPARVEPVRHRREVQRVVMALTEVLHHIEKPRVAGP